MINERYPKTEIEDELENRISVRLRDLTNRINALTEGHETPSKVRLTSILGEHGARITLASREDNEYIAVSQTIKGEGKKMKTRERRWDPADPSNRKSQTVTVFRINERGDRLAYPLYSGFREGDLDRLEKQVSWFEEE
jgi:hypothetical protein